MSWLRRLVAGLSPRRSWFDAKSVHKRSVVDMAEGFLLVLPLSTLSIIPQTLHTHPSINVADPSTSTVQRGSVTARLLGSWVGNQPGVMDVCLLSVLCVVKAEVSATS